MYHWRRMTDAEREAILEMRKLHNLPWHSPPTWDSGPGAYLLTAACYEHRPFIGHSKMRLTEFSNQLLATLKANGTCHAWSVLPNHYHAIVTCTDIVICKAALAKLHGRSSYFWNGEEFSRGRKVWHASAETCLRSERHFWATLNYVHHNPVKHGYVETGEDWEWSSARHFIKEVGRKEMERIWRTYPIRSYGKTWDL